MIRRMVASLLCVLLCPGAWAQPLARIPTDSFKTGAVLPGATPLALGPQAGLVPLATPGLAGATPTLATVSLSPSITIESPAPAVSAEPVRGAAPATLIEAAQALTILPSDNGGTGRVEASGREKFDGQNKPGSGNSSVPPAGGGQSEPTRALVMENDSPLFPGLHYTFVAKTKAQEAAISAVSKAGASRHLIVVTPMEKGGTAQGHYRTATLVRVAEPELSGPGPVKATLVAEKTVSIVEYEPDQAGLQATFSPVPSIAGDAGRVETLVGLVKALSSDIANTHYRHPETVPKIRADTRPETVVNWFADSLNLSLRVRQELLAIHSVERRLERLAKEMYDLKAKSEVEKKEKDKKSDAADDDPTGIKALQAKIEAADPPPHVREVVLKELKKLAAMGPQSSEAPKIRDYLDWILDVPWSKRTEDNIDLPRAEEILNRNHFGLDKIKERIIEFLAIRKKTGSVKGSILCLVGPHGTGKTSIASAIAEALGRKFVRVSLGGVSDQSELRGHRRTYVDAMPGSVIAKMKEAGTVNPVMLLDEVDKMGDSAYHGSPRAALLEILDPKQNNTFRDHYLNVAYDLSEVFFIITANDISSIPGPLRDRMEVIEFSGYSTLEKIQIVQKHIIPEKEREVGLKEGETSMTPGAIRRAIEGYTMESGLRKIYEVIGTILRKISAWTLTKGKAVPPLLKEEHIEEILGLPDYSLREVAENGVGVATGLAVNDYGGSAMNIEVVSIPGEGKVQLRKQMLEMTYDSVRNAYGFIKSIADKLRISQEILKSNDIEVAFTPAHKIDGPSAGIGIATAIASRLTGRKVRPGVAMTGEITLTGRVLPIGGLREKVMAAHRHGMKVVLFPAANLKDVKEIPAEVLKEIELIPVKTADEVFEHALEPAGSPS